MFSIMYKYIFLIKLKLYCASETVKTKNTDCTLQYSRHNRKNLIKPLRDNIHQALTKLHASHLRALIFLSIRIEFDKQVCGVCLFMRIPYLYYSNFLTEPVEDNCVGVLRFIQRCFFFNLSYVNVSNAFISHINQLLT